MNDSIRFGKWLTNKQYDLDYDVEDVENLYITYLVETYDTNQVLVMYKTGIITSIQHAHYLDSI